jgi:hypothetical protein
MNFANAASSLYLVAVIASTNPPMKSMMVGCANEPIKALLLIGVPKLGSSTLMKLNMLSDVVRSMSTKTKTDVVQMGIASEIHIDAANMNSAMTRCSITVNPGMPKLSVGISRAINVNMIETDKPIIFFKSMIIFLLCDF